MSGRRAKMLRRASTYNTLSIKRLKRLYKGLPLPKRLNFIKLEGRMITITNEYYDQLKMGIFPATTPQEKDTTVT